MNNDDPLHLTSPDGSVEVTITCENGRLRYVVRYNDTQVITSSLLGLSFTEGTLSENFRVVSTVRTEVDETWSPVWGRYNEIHDHHKELRLELKRSGDGPTRLDLIFRVFDDGIGFRYELPDQPALTSFTVTDELTEFNLATDYTAWWIPGDYDSYEYIYEKTPASEIDRAHTPLTLRANPNCYLSIHEAALFDYPAMTVVGPTPSETDGHAPSTDEVACSVNLTPLPDGTKAHGTVPHQTPWRTIQLGTNPGDLVESPLLLNLNDPPSFNADWVSPGMYIGIWWALHIGKYTWTPGPNLGATTENTKEYIDFAADHDIPMLLVEGWNEGWDGEFADQDFTSPNPQYDLHDVVQYGTNRGVDLVAHCETGANFLAFEDQLEEAFSLYGDLDVSGVKTGYVGELPDEHHHHDQRLVNHHHHVISTAAKHGLLLDVHEGIKPTGLRRTYPNLLTTECVRGMEYNAWSEGNPPSHTVTLPFTRMLAGPMDYTPGIFDVRFPEYEHKEIEGHDGAVRVHTTRARQLALLVILFSGLQMAADLPENYHREPEFEFVQSIPATWDGTRVLDAVIGEYITIARRHGDEWFLASATNEKPRTLDVPLDFLSQDTYTATIYRDGDDCDIETNPEAVAIDNRRVSTEDSIRVSLVSGGGTAIHLEPT
ncbi:glycoside hydrolase family 97 protein [Halolamina sp.]|jgi:alpha-glucosidase|uniref:glycoside hydrolase family 97 protein n=1 Tax=Halolamina sp. TaxID=1940283 RepID=UPI00356545DB